MEATIILGEKEYTGKANAITPFHYKNQFKSDILKDTMLALGGVNAILDYQDVEGKNSKAQFETMVNNIDTTLIYQLLWSFIKTANPSGTPAFFKWLEEVDYLPMTDLMLNEGFIDLLTGNIHRKK